MIKRYSGGTTRYPETITQYPTDEIALNAPLMVKVAKQIREFKEIEYVNLPIHDAPFLRALQVPIETSWQDGVKIVSELTKDGQLAFGGEGFDSRERQVQNDSGQLFNQTNIDSQPNFDLNFDSYAFDEIFEAIKRLKSHQEIVQYKIPGLFNVTIGILPFEQLIILPRKHPKVYKQLMSKLVEVFQQIIMQLDALAVDKIYFFDSMGKVDFLGKTYYKKYYYPYVEHLLSVQNELVNSTLVLNVPICKSLKAIDKLEKVQSSKLVSEFKYQPVRLKTEEGSYPADK